MGVNRRTFVIGAGAAVGAAATTGVWQGGSALAATGGAFTSIADDAELIASLRALPSVRAAERAFGAADWSAARGGTLSAVSGYGDRVYCVPLATRGSHRTLLALSDPRAAEGRERLDRAARRSGDVQLFTDDVVVQLREGRQISWSTVDGRPLVSWRLDGDRRVDFGGAAIELTRALDQSALVLAARLQPPEHARSGDVALLAGAARGKAAVRQASIPLAG
jgi:hypothetical protein